MSGRNESSICDDHYEIFNTAKFLINLITPSNHERKRFPEFHDDVGHTDPDPECKLEWFALHRSHGCASAGDIVKDKIAHQVTLNFETSNILFPEKSHGRNNQRDKS